MTKIEYRNDLTAERLRACLSYYLTNGEFRRLAATARCTRVGDIAGSTDSAGYRQIKIGGVSDSAPSTSLGCT